MGFPLLPPLSYERWTLYWAGWSSTRTSSAISGQRTLLPPPSDQSGTSHQHQVRPNPTEMLPAVPQASTQYRRAGLGCALRAPNGRSESMVFQTLPAWRRPPGRHRGAARRDSREWDREPRPALSLSLSLSQANKGAALRADTRGPRPARLGPRTARPPALRSLHAGRGGARPPRVPRAPAAWR